MGQWKSFCKFITIKIDLTLSLSIQIKDNSWIFKLQAAAACTTIFYGTVWSYYYQFDLVFFVLLFHNWYYVQYSIIHFFINAPSISIVKQHLLCCSNYYTYNNRDALEIVLYMIWNGLEWKMLLHTAHTHVRSKTTKVWSIGFYESHLMNNSTNFIRCVNDTRKLCEESQTFWSEFVCWLLGCVHTRNQANIHNDCRMCKTIQTN